MQMQQISPMHLLCCKRQPPVCQNIEEDRCWDKTAADEFESNVRQRHFGAVLRMLKYDPDSCPVNNAKEFTGASGYHVDPLWALVLEYYGVSYSYGVYFPSLEKWHELLTLLVRHKDIDVNVHQKYCEFGDYEGYNYSPLCILLFGSGSGVRVIENAWHVKINNALSLFKQEKVRFDSHQTTITWLRRSIDERSIFYHLFCMYKSGQGTQYFGQTVDLDFLDRVIKDLIELGVDTKFFCSYDDRVYTIDDNLEHSSCTRLKEVFKHACWKRDMKWVPRVHQAPQMQKLRDMHFNFE